MGKNHSVLEDGKIRKEMRFPDFRRAVVYDNSGSELHNAKRKIRTTE